jgi:hypothetical protein
LLYVKGKFLTVKQRLAVVLPAMLKCPHCGKPIPDALITARSGQIGGKKTAERGSEYFRKIAAMRKTRAGGRPKQDSKAE